MNSAPLRILIDQLFAAELSNELTIPHELRTLHGQSAAEIAELMSSTEVLVSGEFYADWRDANNHYPRLVHTVGAGVDGIDFDNLPSGCTVCNVYGHQRGVAEQAFMMMMVLQHKLMVLDDALRQGDWSPQFTYLPEVSNRNLLVLGLGHIGTELVRWGHFLDMNVTALTRSPEKRRDTADGPLIVGSLRDVNDYLPDADFVVVAIPSAPETNDLIGEEQLNLMKPEAFIINVGRGPVINEEALYNALKSERIAGAGLGVWYRYPAMPDEQCHPGNLPFHLLDNVVLTPHKPTVETMQYRWRKIAENIRRFAAGEQLENVVRVL